LRIKLKKGKIWWNGHGLRFQIMNYNDESKTTTSELD
jgi:hypothetical protein